MSPRFRRRLLERGAQTVEAVIILPVVLLVLFGIVHLGVYYHARNIAVHSAQEGVQAARTMAPSSAHGATTDYLDQTAQNVLLSPQVAVDSSAERITVTVSGESLSLVPGLDLRVQQTASGPVEQYIGG